MQWAPGVAATQHEWVCYAAMGKNKVHFVCRHCGHCCTDVVCLPTPWDVARIARETGASPDTFLEFLTPDEVSEVAANDPSWLSHKGERYIMALRRGKKGCHFLSKKTRYCKIYESRPILCRLYPFKLHETKKGEYKAFTLHKDVECPKCGDGEVKTKPLYALYKDDSEHQDEYAELVSTFNRKRYAKKSPVDFIAFFMDGQ